MLWAIGALLAVSGFFGLDHYLERALWKFREWARSTGRTVKDKFWKLEFPLNAVAWFLAFCIALNVLMAVGFVVGLSDPPPMITDSQKEGAGMALGLFVETLLVLPLLIAILLWFLWYPLYVMSKAPNGVVGSLGLLLVILDIVARYFGT